MTQPPVLTNLHRAGRSASPNSRPSNGTKEMLLREHSAMRAHGRDYGFPRRGPTEGAKSGRRVGSSVTATTDFLAPDILNKCGRAVPAHPFALHITFTPAARAA